MQARLKKRSPPSPEGRGRHPGHNRVLREEMNRKTN
jgi:hypothetical protein